MAEAEPLDGDLVTASGLRLPAEALSWRFSRSSGPGGQGVNTTDSRVELSADLTRLAGSAAAAARARLVLGDSTRVVASTERSQLQNRQAARRRLAERLEAAGAAPALRRRTRPSAGAVERRLRAKREGAERKAGRRRIEEE